MIYTINNNKTLEITYTSNGELAAHTCCIAHRSNSQLEIIDLFATQDYGNMGFEDMLLEEVLGYAYEHDFTSVVVTIGPEPFNPKPYLSEAQCIAWYQAYGFECVPSIFANSRMEYKLPTMENICGSVNYG